MIAILMQAERPPVRTARETASGEDPTRKELPRREPPNPEAPIEEPPRQPPAEEPPPGERSRRRKARIGARRADNTSIAMREKIRPRQFQKIPICAVLLQPGTLPGAPVAVRHTEGLVHGFLVLSTMDGNRLAQGDLTQVAV